MAFKHVRPLQGRKISVKTAHMAKASTPRLFPHAAGDHLKAGRVNAEALLRILPSAAALWSLDRRVCFLNDTARQLFGFGEEEIARAGFSWLNRIHPDDRVHYVASWNKLQSGQPKAVSCYRFFPKERTGEMRLKEVAFGYPVGDGNVRGVFSLYSEERDPEDGIEIRQIGALMRNFSHEIANKLQTISGELDLLMLAGNLSEPSSATVRWGVQQICKLTHEISEYLSPSPAPTKVEWENPGAVISEVISGLNRSRGGLGLGACSRIVARARGS
jgi:signal transduction histidine kinase